MLPQTYPQRRASASAAALAVGVSRKTGAAGASANRAAACYRPSRSPGRAITRNSRQRDKTLESLSMARWGEDNQTRQQPRKSCQNRSV
ncbi:hypothetical protein VL20_4038 [Microcystis panniformis FACHB-1757]|uniref:Uncharacterized protein n=1 Tax=Microcystis panniformis FACHB-1757 TaxID=1638788 RepID=A0A0K1S4R1_9CHRO|nr:hypothetical protein VL20_4038 [Microcystis panniformis FACHB-1757]